MSVAAEIDRSPENDPQDAQGKRSQSEGDRTVAAGADASAEAADANLAMESLLVAQAKRDPKAFGVLYERYIDRIYTYIYSRVQNAQDAEDLTARTFYKALNKLHTYEDRGLPFTAWLYRIAHNLVANWHRDRSRRRFIPLDSLRLPGLKRSDPEEIVARSEEHEALWEAIDRLPDDRRDLLIYKFGNRLSNLEIGKLMDRSEGAIKSLYFRTLAALRKDLKAQEWKRGDSND